MQLTKYQRAAIITITATLLLIFVGGLVRAAGAGLGCPDWPHCFGQWIPPLRAEDLPPGFDATKFNVYQTWLEYLNRLVGVVIGLLIFWTLIRSLPFRKTKPIVFWGSLVAFLLVGFQGWLGGVVVKSELEAWIITTHMITALAIVCLLIFNAFQGSKEKFATKLGAREKRSLTISASFLLAFSLVQVAIGTQVRESIDLITRADSTMPRTDWLSHVGSIDTLHRSLSFLVLMVATVLFLQINNSQIKGTLAKSGRWILNLVVLQMAFGIGLAYFGMPAPLQVFHLLTASITICNQFFFLLLLSNAIVESSVP